MGTTEVTTVEELESIVGLPIRRAAEKVRAVLDPVDRAFIAASPFLVLSTSDAEGRCDASPKGDPPGFVHVLDDTTLVVPERPGNRRVDGYRNVLANPHAGLIFVVPGRTDTLRVNGRARVVSDAPWFEDLTVKGHRPVLALVLDVEEVFYHCAKAFMRSKLWDPEAQVTAAACGLPSTARIAHRFDRGDTTLAELEEYYGPTYAEKLYRA